MRKLLFFILIGCLVQCFELSAEENVPELMDLFKEDPSLLIDPSVAIPVPPGGFAEQEEIPAPTIPETAPAPEQAQAPAPEPQTVAAPPVPVQPPVAVAPEIHAPETPAPERQLSSETTKTVSELEALPGVNDFAIILSGDQFFPALIRMKNGGKSRLLFATTGQKSAALVFVRPKINRWIAPKPTETSTLPREPASVEELREVNASKVAEIQFDAEPGVYQFYDALTGAKGQISVE